MLHNASKKQINPTNKVIKSLTFRTLNRVYPLNFLPTSAVTNQRQQKNALKTNKPPVLNIISNPVAPIRSKYIALISVKNNIPTYIVFAIFSDLNSDSVEDRMCPISITRF